MKAKIIDEDYLQWEESRSYDKIIASCMEYAYQAASANGGILVLKFNDIDSYDSKFLFKIARLCNTINTIPIYLNLGFRDYRKFMKVNQTEYKVKRMGRNNKYIEVSVNGIHNKIASDEKLPYSEDIFEKIYKFYWEIEETEFNETMTAIGEEEDV